MNKNELREWKTLSEERLFDTRWLKIGKEVCELPNGKVINDFYTIWQPDWVLILPQTTEGKWILTRQYRHGTRSISMEFPAGIVEAGEDHLAAAKRELEEEAKLLGGKYDFIGEFPMNPDRHRGRFFVYLATRVVPGGSAKADDTEDIRTLALTTNELEFKMRSGEFFHALQMAAYFKAKLMHGELF